MSNSPRRPTVLLVEDCEDDAFFFRLCLRKAGLDCDVIQLMDGTAAITYLEGCLQANSERVCPDLIFLDLKIPSYSGFEVLTWLQAQAFNPPLDVAVLSGSENESDMQRAAALGASDYIVKPVQRSKLASRFAAWHQRQETTALQSAKPFCDAPSRSA